MTDIFLMDASPLYSKVEKLVEQTGSPAALMAEWSTFIACEVDISICGYDRCTYINQRKDDAGEPYLIGLGIPSDMAKMITYQIALFIENMVDDEIMQRARTSPCNLLWLSKYNFIISFPFPRRKIYGSCRTTSQPY